MVAEAADTAGVPARAVGVDRQEERRKARELLEGFSGRIAPIRQKPGYLVGLAVVAVAMALLPLLYFALVAAAGWGVVYYVLHVWPRLGGLPFTKVRLIAYLVPPAAGAILVVFMMIAAFPRRRLRVDPVPLERDKERTLFEFIQRICVAVGAPAPREIAVDLEVNASAGPRAGFFDLLRGHLRLTLGLPLVEGLTAAQLASVVAHEFGHFTQRTAMLFHYVIATVNGWFYRVVFEESAVDRQLESAGNGAGAVYASLIGLSALFIGLSRRVLSLLLHLGHLLSAYLSRQMEFDADRHAAVLAGSGAAGSALREILALTYAERSALHDLGEYWSDRQLVRDVPQLVAAHDRVLRPATRPLLAQWIAGENRSAFDTHPSISERLRALAALDAPGVYRGTHSPTLLFADFRALARRVSAWKYVTSMGVIDEGYRWCEPERPETMLRPPGVRPEALGVSIAPEKAGEASEAPNDREASREGLGVTEPG